MPPAGSMRRRDTRRDLCASGTCQGRACNTSGAMIRGRGRIGGAQASRTNGSRCDGNCRGSWRAGQVLRASHLEARSQAVPIACNSFVSVLAIVCSSEQGV